MSKYCNVLNGRLLFRVFLALLIIVLCFLFNPNTTSAKMMNFIVKFILLAMIFHGRFFLFLLSTIELLLFPLCPSLTQHHNLHFTFIYSLPTGIELMVDKGSL